MTRKVKEEVVGVVETWQCFCVICDNVCLLVVFVYFLIINLSYCEPFKEDFLNFENPLCV